MPKGVKRKAADGQPVVDKGKAAVYKSGSSNKIIIDHSKLKEFTAPTKSPCLPLQPHRFYKNSTGKSESDSKEATYEPPVWSCGKTDINKVRIRGKTDINKVRSRGKTDINKVRSCGKTDINKFSDEILLKIFSLTNSMTLTKVINRVCKRWNSLSKDKLLWRRVDLSFVRLGFKSASAIVELYCSEFTWSLSLRALLKKDWSRRPENHPPCLTRTVIENIMQKCRNLQEFSISYEELGAYLSPRTHNWFCCLPATLTHLSLAYCNIQSSVFKALFKKDFPLKSLVSLNIEGVSIGGDVCFDDLQFPPTLTSLILRDFIPDTFPFSAINENLLHLDIGVSWIDSDDLIDLSTSLKNLKELNMSGCLFADYEANTIDVNQFDPIEDDEWLEIFMNGFPSLSRLNIRNVKQNDGELLSPIMDCLSPDVVHVIDSDGTSRGEWSNNALQASDVERERYSFEKRKREEREDYVQTYGCEPSSGSSDENYDDEDDDVEENMDPFDYMKYKEEKAVHKLMYR